MIKGVSFARDMGSEPGNAIFPQSFIQRARAMFRGIAGVKVSVLDLADMKRNNMGAIIGVGAGSVHDPAILIIEYNGGNSEKPIALVGKGITFDTGGISLKPNSGQWKMKSDLSGAAAVAGTLYSVAARGEAVNLIGVMAMAENMPDGKAIRPGDVLETMSGKTVEIRSTDAEGRLVLSDALTYTQRTYDPVFLLDIATLTGSAGRAVGEDYAALFTRDDWDMSERMMTIGKDAGEEVWPLPLNDGHFSSIRSSIGDIVNAGVGPGASTGAAFVGNFVDKNRPWVHIDMASVDWIDKRKPTTPKGHAGWGVRFMDQLVRDREMLPLSNETSP